jgi:hypothetical protein
MKRNKWVTGIVLFLLAFGCASEKTNDAAGYLELFDKAGRGIMEEKTVNDITYSLLYKPLAYMAIKEDKAAATNSEKLKGAMDNYKGFEYYTLRVKIDQPGKDVLSYDSKGASDYTERVQYYAFDMQNDIKLVSDGDTLPCALYHYERNYNLTDFTNFMVSFPSPKDASKDRTFVYEDKYLGTGTIKLTIKAEDINQLPNFN